MKKLGSKLTNSLPKSPAAAKAPKPAAMEVKPATDKNGDGVIDEHDYETENALRTLMDAEKIKMNPERMQKVHKLAGRHHKALAGIRSIQDIKDTYDDKFGSGKKD